MSIGGEGMETLSWLYEQSELIAVIRLMFSWMPVQLQDVCTAAVAVTFLFALMKIILLLKNLIFNWT